MLIVTESLTVCRGRRSCAFHTRHAACQAGQGPGLQHHLLECLQPTCAPAQGDTPPPPPPWSARPLCKAVPILQPGSYLGSHMTLYPLS